MNYKNNRSIATLLIATCCAFAPLTTAFADHHEPAQTLTGKVQQFYAKLSAGEFADAMDMLKVGSGGFVAHGMLIEIASEQVKQYAAAQMQKDRDDKGVSLSLQPKHINIHPLGEGTAVATFYIQGTVSIEGREEDEHFINRGSLVFTKDGDDWKIAHFHVSELTVEGEED